MPVPAAWAGRKHESRIELVPWQQDIVDAHPESLLRGLFHSDGCRVLNPVQGGRYSYTRYHFSNRSHDIHRIAQDALDRLGIPWRMNSRVSLSVARREGVEALDRFIGPKA